MARGVGGARKLRGIALIVGGVIAMVASVVGLASGDGSSRAGEATTTTAAAPTSTTTPIATAEEAKAFVNELMTAANGGDTVFLVNHLDPVVIRTYGDAACKSYVESANIRLAVTVTGVEGPSPYVWTVDGRSTTVPDVWNVHVTDTTTGQPVDRDVHVGSSAGQPTWFTDCGTPL